MAWGFDCRAGSNVHRRDVDRRGERSREERLEPLRVTVPTFAKLGARLAEANAGSLDERPERLAKPAGQRRRGLERHAAGVVRGAVEPLLDLQLARATVCRRYVESARRRRVDEAVVDKSRPDDAPVSVSKPRARARLVVDAEREEAREVSRNRVVEADEHRLFPGNCLVIQVAPAREDVAEADARMTFPPVWKSTSASGAPTILH